MAKCYKCGKNAMTGNNRSHSNVATKRKFKANIQSKVIDGIKKKICTACIRTMNKVS